MYFAERSLEGRLGLVSGIETSDQAFFQRSQKLRWEFFAEVFHRFVGTLAESVPGRFCAHLSSLRDRFADVLVIDGSKLTSVARRLKILRNVKAVVLPGCLIAVYDLFRGFPRLLRFCADAAKAEMTRAKEVLGLGAGVGGVSGIRAGTLLIGDRLYCTADFFAELSGNGVWGLFRRNRTLKLSKVRGGRIRKSRLAVKVPGATTGRMAWRLEEYLVKAGLGQGARTQTLRRIRLKAGHRVYEWLTNVLDPARLRAEEIPELYYRRWTIERMFFDPKEVLNLNRVYAANPNAVALQVYAAGMVYAAMRVAQAEAAQQVGIEPEAISPQKFFPRAAAACATYAISEHTVEKMIRMNPGVQLRRPTYARSKFATISVEAILVKQRSSLRRKRKFSPEGKTWKSFAHIRGGSAYLERN